MICYMCAIYRCILILRTTNSSRGPVTKTQKKSKMNETPDVTLAYNNQLIEMRLSVKLLAISSEVYVCSGFSFNNIYLHLSIYICFVYLFCCLHLSFTSHSIILSPFMLSNTQINNTHKYNSLIRTFFFFKC